MCNLDERERESQLLGEESESDELMTFFIELFHTVEAIKFGSALFRD